MRVPAKRKKEGEKRPAKRAKLGQGFLDADRLAMRPTVVLISSTPTGPWAADLLRPDGFMQDYPLLPRFADATRK